MAQQKKLIAIAVLLSIFCAAFVLAIPGAVAYAQAPTAGTPPASRYGAADPEKFISGCSLGGFFSGGILTTFLACAIGFTNWVVWTIGSFGLIIVTWLIELALALNSAVVKLPAVQIGWRIVRDIANLGFVLGIVVIAFATILRSQTYGMKQILWKFIVMAVLINFSLAITGVMLDFAGVITQFFLDKISDQGANGFGAALMSAISVIKIQSVNDAANNQGIVGAFKTISRDTMVALISIAFSILFTFLTLIVLSALAVMLFIRFLYLGILLIVMPVTWLFWVFPNLSHIFSQWWNQFVRWTMFAPASLFFIYLAIYTMLGQQQYLSDITNKLISEQNNQGTAEVLQKDLVNFSANPALVIGQMALMIGLLFASLIVANKIGITGAKAAQAFAETFSKGYGSWVGKKAVRTAGYLAYPSPQLGAIGKRGKGFTSRIAGGLHTVQTTLSKVPGLKQLGRAYRLEGKVERAPGVHMSLYDSTFASAMMSAGLWKRKKKKSQELAKSILEEEGGEKKEEKKT